MTHFIFIFVIYYFTSRLLEKENIDMKFRECIQNSFMDRQNNIYLYMRKSAGILPFAKTWSGSMVFIFLNSCVLLCLFVLLIFVLCLVSPTLPVSMNCSLLIVPSGCSNVYLIEWSTLILWLVNVSGGCYQSFKAINRAYQNQIEWRIPFTVLHEIF